MQHTEGWFRGRDNVRLYRQSWLPSRNPAAVLVIVHGLAEHSGRYLNLVNHFVPRDHAICAFDLRGHGKSEGLRGYVDRFSDYVEDLGRFFTLVCEEHRGLPVFLVGHSMGGLIAAVYAAGCDNGLTGLVLSAPVLKSGSSVSRLSMAVAQTLSVLAPKLGVTVLDASTICQDENVVNAYVNDPLVYRGKIRARLGAELIKAMAALSPSKLADIELPILIMHGAVDHLVSPESSSILYESVGSKDKTLKYYEGFCHEIFNEPGREQVLEDMERWLRR
ncbi:MAG: hypothetical protein A2147_10700 [Chloroflexi bacterium RBG_16_57_8]|nr:MAG: hypothetical protein A2147_10700 [Chloroflexi bacterium RBG_16_57_8]